MCGANPYRNNSDIGVFPVGNHKNFGVYFMKKNIIASILEALGVNIFCFVIRFMTTASYYVWWIYLISIFSAFIGCLLFNIGADLAIKRKTL